MRTNTKTAIDQFGKQQRNARRHEAIRARFLQLHHHERMRLDDVYRRLVQEFFLSERTIERIIRKQSKPQA
jgi:hypothetical protein